MESQLSQDPLDHLISPPDMSAPITPELSHAQIPGDSAVAINKVQDRSIEHAPSSMTPPPSTQVRPKSRTPTPPVSHISTPPPTVEASGISQENRIAARPLGSTTAAQLESATPDELRAKIADLQSALKEAKMSAAHHKLQYQMLSQEHAAAMERMAVEARMAQSENDVIHSAEQAKAAATPQPSPIQEGSIPVHKDLYQRMCREINQLRDANGAWKVECDSKDHFIERQDEEIASLTDKVTLMRERIRESREHLQKYRSNRVSSRHDATPRSVYGTPHRSHINQAQAQPFAALLQASEMASQESARSGVRGASGRKGHTRNMHSTSSLPATPQRAQKTHAPSYQTPSGRRAPLKIPSTAPMPRTSALRTPDVYAQHALPVSQTSLPLAAQSEGTVSASENEDNDSEAETDIIEQDDEINESSASRAASQMLRSSQEEQQAKQDSLHGRGMLQPRGDKSRQTKLFGAVRKANVERDDGRPAKRARIGQAVGLGIAGVRD